MPTYYEDAAHMMLFLTAAGLRFVAGIDPRAALTELARMLDHDRRRLGKLSHFDATALLAALEENGLVRCDSARRMRVIKVLGTTLANLLAATGHVGR